jgi:Na+/phosphate symporter
MISDERLAKALTYISETDQQAAELKTDVERQQFKLKKIKSAIFSCSEGNIEERRSEAEVADSTQEQVKEYLVSLQDYNEIDNKRKTEQLIIEVWRSLNANRRQGNI